MSTKVEVDPRVALVSRYRTDLPAFARELKIETKREGLQPLSLNRAQSIVHRRISAQRRREGRVRAIILKARQMGVSTYVAARNFRGVVFTPHISCVVVADEKKRSEKLFRIYDRFYTDMPEALRPAKRYSRKHTHLYLEDPVGSSVEIETAGDKAAGRAVTTQLAHLSEFAYWPDAETTMAGMMQAIPDDGSEVVIESTANGVGGTFHAMWTEAEARTSGWVAIFLPWFIHEEYTCEPSFEERAAIEGTPDAFERKAMTEGLANYDGGREVLSVAQLAWRRRTIRDKCAGDLDLFHQEYPATPREAFLTSGNVYFEPRSLTRYDEVCVPPVSRGNIVLSDYHVSVVPDARGYLRVWVPPQWDSAYCIFADTATGRKVGAHRDALDERGGLDYSSAHVFDAVSRAYVACLHGRMPPELFAESLFALGYWYSGPKPGHRSLRSVALLAVEKNHSSGETVLKLLKDDFRYENLFYHRTINRRTNKPTQTLGWVTNAETRAVMLDTFAMALREETVSLWDSETLAECFTFVKDDTGKFMAQEGCHDDRVVSAAGCLSIAPFVHVSREEAPRELVRIGSSPTGEYDY